MATPASTVRAVAAGVCRLIAGDLTEEQINTQINDLSELYATTTDVRHPLSPAGIAPLRTREEVRRHFSGGPGQARRQAERMEAVGRVHETADPEVVVFEFSYVGSVHGREFDVPCVFVTRVRDGVIVESRDYLDHARMARAFDRPARIGQ